MVRKIVISEKELRDCFIEHELTARECATIFGCSVNVIHRRLDRFGIPRPALIQYTPTKEWLEEHYLTKQLTMLECGKLLKCHEVTIRQHLKKHCIPIRHHGYKSEAITKAWLEEYYINQNLSSFECGKLLDCDYQLILNALKRHGLPPHNPIQKSKERMKDLTELGLWDLHGSKNPNWRGGISRFPYCWKFNEEFKEHIRDKFGRKCFLCENQEKNRKHSVHHIDFNKNSICNGKEWAFVPLCKSCHSKTGVNRHYYFNLLINYWIMNSMINFGSAGIYYDGI